MLNALTFDIEEWFCAVNLEHAIHRSAWDAAPARVVETTRQILDLLRRYRVEATFFVLGWVAERYPDLVREIHNGGHEIATHGYSHIPLTSMTPSEFERDLDRAVWLTEQIIGEPVLGFRAPSFTVTPSTFWALDILKDRGLLYDSSIFPTGVHPEYGVPDAPLGIYCHKNALLEIPLSCAEIGGKRVPCAGGAYFRFFPYTLTRSLIDRCHRQKRPVIFYLHPWEIDTGHPRVRLSPLRAVRQYYNLKKTLPRLEKLLLEYQFTSIRKLIGI